MLNFWRRSTTIDIGAFAPHLWLNYWTDRYMGGHEFHVLFVFTVASHQMTNYPILPSRFLPSRFHFWRTTIFLPERWPCMVYTFFQIRQINLEQCPFIVFWWDAETFIFVSHVLPSHPKHIQYLLVFVKDSVQWMCQRAWSASRKVFALLISFLNNNNNNNNDVL